MLTDFLQYCTSEYMTIYFSNNLVLRSLDRQSMYSDKYFLESLCYRDRLLLFVSPYFFCVIFCCKALLVSQK